jgi:hypothetical protein
VDVALVGQDRQYDAGSSRRRAPTPNLTEGTTARSLLLLPLMASLPVPKDGGEVVSPPNIRTIRLRSTPHRTP